MAALSEHLHQSQLILAEIANAAPEHADLALQRALAEHLLASNRLLRQTAGQSGHHSLAGTLDELERVLLEVAHGSPQGVEPLQAQIEDDAILFKIRLLNSTLKNPGNWDSF
jgi:hypothetical protein